MFDRLRKAFQREPKERGDAAPSQGGPHAPVSEWAASRGMSFSAGTLGHSVSMQGRIGGRPWKMELGRPTRDYIAGEELRARYRYLDLRRNPIRNNLVLRHKMAQEVRRYLSDLDFMEVETPVLIKSTPEGAREYVVPVRTHLGKAFVLPQSPQICKQLLMVGGVEKYFQIAKCFRDESARADRQPEFTQIDIEMSFVGQDDVLALTERLFQHLMSEVKGIDIELPFQRITVASFGAVLRGW